jgi:S1-C subfamily serine protease
MKKFLKVLFIALFVGAFLGVTTDYIRTKMGTILAIEKLQSKLYEVQKQYNNLVDNDIELTKIITDKNIDILKLIKMLASYTQNNFKQIQKKVLVVDIEKVLRSSVFVKGLSGMGAGTIIKKTDKSMYILTCYHVVNDIITLNKLGMKMSASIGYSKSDEINKVAGLVIYGAEVIKYDIEHDIALLKTSIVDNELKVANIATSEPNKGDIVFSIGNPLGLLRTVSQGILANKVEGFFISENVTTFGNSGGGLYNINGELVGIPSQVMGYEGGLTKEGNPAFIPESSLGMSRDLLTIRLFLEGVEY